MDDEIVIDDGAEEIIEEVEEAPEPEVATEPEAPKAEKPKETPEQTKARLERQLARVKKQLGEDEPKKPNVPSKTDGLDDNALDYLDLKGVSESEDIKIIENIVKKTGMTVREALKDEYVSAKLEANKKAREVKDATPSSTKRAGAASVDDVSYWYGKYEREGKLPEGMPPGMAEKLVNKRYDALNPRKEPF